MSIQCTLHDNFDVVTIIMGGSRTFWVPGRTKSQSRSAMFCQPLPSTAGNHMFASQLVHPKSVFNGRPTVYVVQGPAVAMVHAEV